MLTKVGRWGNSLGLRIPKSFALELSVEEGSMVDLALLDGQLVVRRVDPTRYDLEELLSEVSEDNLHGETPTGEPAGREVW